ncbi:hypothetical protein BGZ92_006839, partial [Podila epicladia]
MLRSSSFVVLALFILQVAFALIIEPGTYYIESDDGRVLSIGPIPFVYPPPDVPVRLLERDSRLISKWEVKPAANGAVEITTRGDYGEFEYKIIRGEHNWVFASTQKAPQPWSVTSVGGRQFGIQLPNEDEVFTSHEYSFPQVTLEPSEGLPDQKWTFIRIDRDNNYRRGSTNRFC